MNSITQYGIMDIPYCGNNPAHIPYCVNEIPQYGKSIPYCGNEFHSMEYLVPLMSALALAGTPTVGVDY